MTGGPGTGYPAPPAVGGETDTLVGSLERQRATFAWKCADLDAAGLRLTVAASRVTLGGLLRHLAFMEDINFTRDLAGRDLPAPWATGGRGRAEGWEWTFSSDSIGVDATGEELLRLWGQAVTRSRQAVDESLAAGGPESLHRVPSGAVITLRRLLVDMIEEYARHNGQADLIREAVDGRVGEDPPGQPYPYGAARLPG